VAVAVDAVVLGLMGGKRTFYLRTAMLWRETVIVEAAVDPEWKGWGADNWLSWQKAEVSALEQAPPV
jgi:hypothetical protein